MKYQQMDFTEELKIKIKNTESSLKKHVEKLLNENKSVFLKKNLQFDADFNKDGDDPFKPGYSSSVAISISDKTDKNGELIDLHIIKIWECERILLGMPISKHILGSKIIGELLDETLEEIKDELKEYIEELLEDANQSSSTTNGGKS
ncbi:hypothetical protein [Bacillus sp. X1(2014)]|uniref:hypothetical protein n=1 Tax=Bacillus sp. X1(2014) TaxID=1565991 RepID=UPI00119CEE26|nr:hypothetical protein [Bacillus sp. X1(2014)]